MTTEAQPSAEQQPQAGPPAPAAAAPAEPQVETPPWGEDFDPEKAWKLVQGLRSDKEKLSAREVLTPEAKAKLAEYDRLAEASKTELERAQEAAGKAGERIASMTRRAVEAEVKALAATSFADASDAAAFLDLAKYADDEGGIDTEAIKTDLADVLTRKPHLGKITEPPDPRLPRPNPAQGNTRTPSLDELIADAQGKGDFKTVIHLQNQKLASQNGA